MRSKKDRGQATFNACLRLAKAIGKDRDGQGIGSCEERNWTFSTPGAEPGTMQVVTIRALHIVMATPCETTCEELTELKRRADAH